MIALNEALSEVADEIVVGRFGAHLGDMGEAADEIILQPQSRKFGEDRLDLLARQFVILNADRVQGDSCRRKCDFGLLVEGN